MAAVQTPGTPAAVTPPPAAAPPAAEVTTTEESGTGDAILDALADYKPDAEAPGAEAAKKEPKAEPKTEGENAKPTRADVEARLFSDEALGTKEGLEKARGYIERRRSKIDGMATRVTEQRAALDEQTTTIQAAYEAAKAEIEEARAALEPDRARARAIAEIDNRLRNGSIEQMLETLGALRGKTGRQVWDEMANAVISGRMPHAAAPSPEVHGLKQELEGLKRALAEREARDAEGAETAETQQLAGEVKRIEDQVIATASDVSKYPELARYVKLGLRENILAEVVKQKSAAKRSGRKLDNASALATIEVELQKLSPAGASPARSEVAGQSASSPAGASPASPAAASAVDVPITGIAPSQTRSSGAFREKTQEELDADLQRDTPYLSSLLGIDLT